MAILTYSVNVFIHLGRHVVIDDVIDAGNVKAARSDSGGDKNRLAACPEVVQSLFPLPLESVSMYGGGGKSLPGQKRSKKIAVFLCLQENQSSDVKNVLKSIKEVINARVENLLNLIVIFASNNSD